MKINGYDYTELEVLEALEKKGYQIVRWTYYFLDETFPNGITEECLLVKCALKNDLPSEENIWYKVAEREFQKTEKPKLI